MPPSAPNLPWLSACGSGIDPKTFFGVPWRSVITDLNGVTLTFLDRLASERQIEYVLNGPAIARGKVPSHSPEINIIYPDDPAPEAPWLNYGDRLLFMFRREMTEGSLDPACWVPRFAGPIEIDEDAGLTEHATTSYTAYDPWMILQHRPIVTDVGLLVGVNDWVLNGLTGDTLVRKLLDNMASGPLVQPGYLTGSPYMNAFLDWGQIGESSPGANDGPYYTGTMETTNIVETIPFKQGEYVSDGLKKLIDADYCDIIITPIWDPSNRPGVCGEVNVYQTAGEAKSGAVMAWDKPSRSLVSIARTEDGTQTVNETQFYLSTGSGPPLDIDGRTTSLNRYGEMWSVQAWTAFDLPTAISAIEQAKMLLRANGQLTLEVAPCAGRSPVPFLEYGLGDSLPIYASGNLRKPLAPTPSGGTWPDGQLQRVYGMTIDLDDNDLEKVSKLLLSKDAPP